ncbi:MAG: type I methionyl aminopeptidase [Pseudomonadota bacterium]
MHNPKNYESMRVSGKLAATVLDHITNYVKVGVTTEELNQICHDYIIANNAIPAPLNYKGFPKSICTSVNHVVCHGIPSDKKLLDGDIVNIDVTVIVDGWYGDSSRMYFAGKPDVKATRLVNTTYDCLMLGIEQVKPGATLGDIGYTIQSHAEGLGYSVVRDYCGHGIGSEFHAEPSVLHYGKKGHGVVLEEGMFFTIEPMINIGRAETKLSAHDGWTVTTRDRSLSAQFEHTLAVTKDGYEIFTSSPKGLDKPPYAIP